MDDEDAEIRVQAARLLGEAGVVAALPKLVEVLLGENTRVRAACALALARLGSRNRTAVTEALPALSAAIWENDNQDPFLRHALVMGLAGCADAATLAALSADEFPSVRLGVLLAMRRQRDGAIQRFLFDPDIRLAAEAARAIWDVPIPGAFAALAAASGRLIQKSDETSRATEEAIRFVREVWKNKQGDSSTQLEVERVFATEPDERAESLDATGFSSHGNNYLQRLTGTITPSADGEHRFYLTSDDHSVLFIETEGDLSTRRVIARVDGYTDPSVWEGQEGQVSEPIELKAGVNYRIEARHAQGGGGNHLAIGWKRPVGHADVDPSLEAFAKRTIAANLCVAPDGPRAIAALAAAQSLPPKIRAEALEALGQYPSPPLRDLVHGRIGMVQTSPRNLDAFRSVAALTLPALASGNDPELRTAAILIATQCGIALDQKANFASVLDPTRRADERIAALDQLALTSDSNLAKAIDAAIVSTEPELRIVGRRYLLSLDARRALTESESALTSGTQQERQAAILLFGALSVSQDAMVASAARARLDALKSEFASGSLAAPLRLEILEATGSTGSGVSVDLVAIAIEGGSIARGHDVALNNSAVACLRCHAISGVGGHAGPALDGVGARLDRAALLQSIIDPQAVIAAGFASPSAMPAVGPLLTPRETRDLVAYLASLTTPPTP